MVSAEVFSPRCTEGYTHLHTHRMLMGSQESMTCPEGSTGRTAIYPLDGPHSRPHHDVSLCNVMGMGADYLFVPLTNRLYAVVDPIGIPAMMILSILIISLMVIMGHHLQVRVECLHADYLKIHCHIHAHTHR